MPGATSTGCVGQVHTGDLFAALPARLRSRVDLLVANAPYVPTGAIATMPPEARFYEARMALDDGPDGLAVHRRILAGARDWLAPGASLLVEVGRGQAAATAATAALCAAEGWSAAVMVDEDRDATVVAASRAGG